jgi:hypothetical protein
MSRARELHQQGYNLLVVNVGPAATEVWEAADRLGFFVLGRVTEPSEENLGLALGLCRHASCLGWLAPLDVVARLPAAVLIGAQLEEVPGEILPSRVRFIACASRQAAAMANLTRPLLVWGEGMTEPGRVPILGNVLRHEPEKPQIL